MTEKIGKAKIKSVILDLTAESNAIDYLEKAHYFISKTKTKKVAWKWVILTLHSALYGFSICALSQGNPDNVVTKTKKGKEILIDFCESLKRCQDPNFMQTTIQGKTLQLSNQQKTSINKLHLEFRNNFEHYIPKGWYIEIHGMPQIAIDVLDVIHFLALESGNCYRLIKDQKKLVEDLLLECKKILKKGKLYKEAQLLKKNSKSK